MMIIARTLMTSLAKATVPTFMRILAIQKLETVSKAHTWSSRNKGWLRTRCCVWCVILLCLGNQQIKSKLQAFWGPCILTKNCSLSWSSTSSYKAMRCFVSTQINFDANHFRYINAAAFCGQLMYSWCHRHFVHIDTHSRIADKKKKKKETMPEKYLDISDVLWMWSVLAVTTLSIQCI